MVDKCAGIASMKTNKNDQYHGSLEAFATKEISIAGYKERRFC